MSFKFVRPAPDKHVIQESRSFSKTRFFFYEEDQLGKNYKKSLKNKISQ